MVFRILGVELTLFFLLHFLKCGDNAFFSTPHMLFISKGDISTTRAVQPTEVSQLERSGWELSIGETYFDYSVLVVVLVQFCRIICRNMLLTSNGDISPARTVQPTKVPLSERPG